MEKAAEPDQVYFSEAVRTSIPKAEIPCDYVGEFEFKGIPEKVRLYKTAFSNTPIVRDRVALVNTNFVGLSALSEKYTWDVIQPMVDETVGIILSASRAFGGTKRDTNSGRCFLSFESVGNAISAISKWNKDINNIEDIGGQNVKIEIRSSIHWGTLHVMRNTIMGKDMHIAETLCALGYGNEILLTQPVVDAAKAENVSTNNIIGIPLSSLRQCSSRKKWTDKYSELKIYKIDLDALTVNKKDEEKSSK